VFCDPTTTDNSAACTLRKSLVVHITIQSLQADGYKVLSNRILSNRPSNAKRNSTQ